MTDTMFSIRHMATKHGLTHRALRFYEQKKLLHPQRGGNGSTSARRYSWADDQRIGQIVIWTQAGLSLKEIRTLLAYLDQNQRPTVDRYVRQRLVEIEAGLQRQMKAIAALRGEVGSQAAA